MPFNAKGMEFLCQNRAMNSREWYRENRDVYLENVLRPMQQLVTRLTPAMLAIDPKFITEPKVGKTISHVNRDTRFTKDKSLYRENIWCIFIRDKRLYDGLPAFYFDASPQGYSYGCGYYKTSTESLAIMRELIIADDPLFLEMEQAYKKQKHFTLYEDRYKRPRCPDQPPEKQFWLDLKTISFSAFGKDPEVLFAPDLADRLEKQLKKLEPMYAFMMKAEEIRASRRLERDREAKGLRPAFEW